MFSTISTALSRPPERDRRRGAVRRAFVPCGRSGGYQLPHEVEALLTPALKPYRNRQAAYELAVFLARFWTAPGRLAMSFAVDRRALAEHGELDLSEGRIRGARNVLEEVGFIERAIPAKGNGYRRGPAGLQREATRFRFASAYGVLFHAANERRGSARRKLPDPLRHQPLPQPARMPAPVANLNLPRCDQADAQCHPGKLIQERPPLRGELVRGLADDTGFLAKLERLKREVAASRRAAEGRAASSGAGLRDSERGGRA